MRRIVLALLVPLLLLTLACATRVTSAPPAMPAAQSLVAVSFESRPDGAELYLDGNLVGSTSMVYRVPPGVHQVEIRRSGFEPWRRELLVNAHNPTKLNALLVAQK